MYEIRTLLNNGLNKHMQILMPSTLYILTPYSPGAAYLRTYTLFAWGGVPQTRVWGGVPRVGCPGRRVCCLRNLFTSR